MFEHFHMKLVRGGDIQKRGAREKEGQGFSSREWPGTAVGAIERKINVREVKRMSPDGDLLN